MVYAPPQDAIVTSAWAGVTKAALIKAEARVVVMRCFLMNILLN